MILSLCGGGLGLRADVSFADLETQFISEILGQVAHLPVLRGYTRHTQVKTTQSANQSPCCPLGAPSVNDVLVVL